MLGDLTNTIVNHSFLLYLTSVSQISKDKEVSDEYSHDIEGLKKENNRLRMEIAKVSYVDVSIVLFCFGLFNINILKKSASEKVKNLKIY